MPPGSLMKALIRPGAGEKTPIEGDQVDSCFCLIASDDSLW